MGGHDSAVRLISYGYSTVTAAHRLGRFVRLFLACTYGGQNVSDQLIINALEFVLDY